MSFDSLSRTSRWGRGIVCALSLVVAGSALASGPTPRGDLQAAVNEMLGLQDSSILSLGFDPSPGVPVSTEITIEGVDYVLDLEPHSVRSANYQLMIQQEDGTLEPAEPGPLRTLRGVVRGLEGSRVAGAMQHDGLHVFVELPHIVGRYWVEPVDGGIAGAGPDDHVVYHEFDIVASEGVCGFDHGPVVIPEVTESGEGGVAGGQDCFWITELACDSDYEYFLDQGSSTTNVEAEINNIVNTVNLQYETQTNITHEISVLIVRPFEDDPYVGTNVPSSLLGQFQNEWETNLPNLQRDVAHLWTGRDLQGSVIGIALTLGGICTEDGYCLSQDINNFACRTDLTAHELGHLWNGFHCSCSSPAFTMNPSLTCANIFSQGTINSIINHRESRNCLDNPCVATNNNCVQAIVVGSGVTDFTTVGANTDGPSDVLCTFGQVQNDVWFRYTAPCDGPVTVDLCGSTFDTTLAVYDLFCPTITNQALACDDDSSCGQQARVTFEAVVGIQYFIRIGGFEGAEGTGTMTITPSTCPPEPSNNACGTAAPLATGTTPFTTIGATTDGPEEASTCGASSSTQIERDVWFRYTADCNSTVTMRVCDADFDAKLAVYEGLCPGGPETALACNDTSACGAEISFEAIEGELYRVRVGSPDTSTGNATLEVLCASPAPCPGDTNADGVVDVTDLVNVVLQWGSADPGSDLNDDGVVDVKDLLEVILAWGPCI